MTYHVLGCVCTTKQAIQTHTHHQPQSSSPWVEAGMQSSHLVSMFWLTCAHNKSVYTEQRSLSHEVHYTHFHIDSAVAQQRSDPHYAPFLFLQTKQRWPSATWVCAFKKHVGHSASAHQKKKMARHNEAPAVPPMMGCLIQATKSNLPD